MSSETMNQTVPTNGEATSSEPHEPLAQAETALSPAILPIEPSPGEDAAPVEADDDQGDSSTSEETATAGEGAPTEGTGEKKKRRRRRRKKKNGAESAAPEGAELGDGSPGGAPASGAAETGASLRPKKKRREPNEHRERPAFTVGDVVFGKIIEIGEDAMLVDLSGKGTGVFDKLELLLPEDHAVDIERRAEKAEVEADAIMTGKDPNAPVEEAATVAAHDAAELLALIGEKREERTARIIAPTSEPSLPDAQVSEASLQKTQLPEDTAAAPEGEQASELQATAEDALASEPAASPEPASENVIQLPKVTLEVGAPFVAVVHNDGGRGGNVVLTHHPKRGSLAKPFLARAFKEGTDVFGLVTGVIKGGVEVDIDGVRAFAPGSHMDLRLGAGLQPLVGKRLAFRVAQYGKRGRDVVLSRKAMLEAEAKAARAKALETLKVDQVLEGTVRSVVSFGAFVDLGGVEGLVPLSEMSHNRSDGPSDVFRAGEKVAVKVLKIDEKGKIWLSRKSTVADPWGAVREKYKPGSKHSGKVVRIQPFGAFLELEPGIDGLIHTADLSFKSIDHANEVVKEGQEMEVVVAHLDPASHRIGLHPALQGAQAEEAPQKVVPHKSIRAAVVGYDAGGMQVRILGVTGRNAHGYVPSAATGTPRGTELRKVFPMGQIVDAKVLEVDPRRGEVKLSIRALQQDNEKNAYQQYRQKVKEEAKFGTFADLLAKRNISPK